MEAWLPPPVFAPWIGAVQLPLYVGQDIEGFGLLSGLPPLVVVVVRAVGSGMIIGETCLHSKHLLLQLFSHKRNGCLLLN